MTNLWWLCPNCNEKVDFQKGISSIFESDGEASFEPKSGVIFHTILCSNCEAEWSVSISEMCKN